MNDSDIDKTCFISHGEAIVTPERLAKGDISIRTSDTDKTLEIQLTIKNILNYLYEEEIITGQNLFDGQTFQIWQEMHRTSLGLQKAVSSGSPEKLGLRLKAHGFVLLIRRLSQPDLKAIEFAINTFATGHTKFMAQKSKVTYQRAFERLSAILPSIRDRIDTLEALNEIDRNELCENNLKKLVAEVKKYV